ncbi:hypothetical protein Nmel_016203 [Mimus melanotis]
MYSCIFEHRRGVTPVIHVLLRALSLSMDHCQPQAQPLGVGLSPARQKQPQQRAGLIQLHSPLQQASPTPTASKGCTSVAVSL